MPDRLTGPVGGECRCGNSVRPRIARVYGNEQNVVPACAECIETPQGKRYADDIRAIRAHLQRQRGGGG